MRVVFDTNTLAAGAVSKSGTLATLVEAWLNNRFILIVSPEILDELERTFHKPYFTQRLSQETIQQFLTLMNSTPLIVQIAHEDTGPISGTATHPEDDLVLAAALSGGADYLVTGDKQLQRLLSYQGVKIVSPYVFLNILNIQLLVELQ